MSTISEVVTDLINAGTISSQDVATVSVVTSVSGGVTTYTVENEAVWQYNAKTNVNWRFQQDPNSGDPAGSVEQASYSAVKGAFSLNTTLQVLAYDNTDVLLGLPSSGGFLSYYLVSDTTLKPGSTKVTFPITDLGTSATYTAPPTTCYVEGTRIRTERGDVPVEELAAGDMVAVHTRQGMIQRPAVWIGRRVVNIAAHPDPETALPIRIRRNAFAGGQPSRDLLVSPDHAIFIDGLLVPAKLLVNGGSIVQEQGWTSVVYFHVELPEHAVIFAEDLAAESYLDTGNRAVFENAGGLMMLHPDFSISARLQRREDGSCAPLVVAASLVRPIWHQLALRSRRIGYPASVPDAVREPRLRLRTPTCELRPLCATRDGYLFMLPRDTREVRLVSRAARPNRTQPWIDDVRRLGVRIGRITVKDGLDLSDIALDSAALGEGWWAVETEGTAMARWTDGDAHLVLPSGGGVGRVLALQLAGAMTYPIAQEDEVLPARKVA
jgi:Hint domain